jgi:2-polyprenyl-6-methoxyphenol hydroxylase-like FAD-dependent oxidoreductase
MQSDRTEHADVVVVGSGPGGAVLAYLLARSDVDVALVERAADFQREFRGFGYTPGVSELFGQMGLTDSLLALDHETVRKGEFTLFGESIEMVDFALLDTDYPYALLMEQPALLELLVTESKGYEGFSFYPSTTVTDLVVEGNRVVGVRAHDRARGEDVEFRGRLVVGADGRYSAVRTAAGIDPGLFESGFELVWFKLPADAVGATAQGRIEREGMLLYFGLGGGELQVGWFIEDGTYPTLRREGIAAFRDRLARVDPRLRDALDTHLTSFDQCSLLDVAPGLAPTWIRDGLILIGDAAHVASPIGAQGNALAIQDAVVAHHVVTEALDRDYDVLPASVLAAYEARRRPAVEEVLALQRSAERILTVFVKHGDRVPPRLARGVAKLSARLMERPVLARRAVERFAFGPDRVTVDTTRFVD